MAKGKLSERVNIKGYNEVEQLGDAFNKMGIQLESLDRSRNEFVSNASHELKTPMSAIKVLADSLLSSETNDVAVYKEFMGDITHEIDRLNNIVSDLLDIVKYDKENVAGEHEKIELMALVRVLPEAVKNPFAIKSRSTWNSLRADFCTLTAIPWSSPKFFTISSTTP